MATPTNDEMITAAITALNTGATAGIAQHTTIDRSVSRFALAEQRAQVDWAEARKARHNRRPMSRISLRGFR